jgi:tetratricopeptide (TPR) repeat protein
VPSNPNAALTALGLLRSALREATPSGLPPNEWFALLQQSTEIPRFDEAVASLMQAVGPYTAQTEPDTLVLSFAPETHRLIGYLHVLRGDYETAILAMGVAADMYERMRARFPELYSTALGEQADMLFMRDPAKAEEAILLARRGIEALPAIQEQKLEAMQAGRRMRLAQYLLSAGREPEAIEELRKIRDDETRVRTAIATLYLDLAQRFLTMPPDQRPSVMAWVQASLSIAPKEERAWRMKAWLRAELGGPDALDETLAEARAAGLSEEELDFIQGFVIRSFTPPETQSATQSAPAATTAPGTAPDASATGPASRPVATAPARAAPQPATRPATVP